MIVIYLMKLQSPLNQLWDTLVKLKRLGTHKHMCVPGINSWDEL